MKMASQIMTEIAGIEVFPIISLVIFFGFFTGMTLYVVSLRKAKMHEMEHFVLDDTDQWENDRPSSTPH